MALSAEHDQTPDARAVPLVVCIILNWNNHEQTSQCLGGLQQWCRGRYLLKVVVVDNGSSPAPVPSLTASFPGAELLRLPENRGFTGGCNAGAATELALAGDYLLFLNNDTVIKSDFLDPLVRLLESTSSIGIVSPIERGIDPPVASAFEMRVDLTRGLSIGLPHAEDPDLATPKFYPSDQAHGGMMLIRQRLFEELGRFDEAFFAYYEDVDLCLRVRAAGYRCGFFLSSDVYHHVGGSTRKANDGGKTLRSCLNRRNSILLVRKHGTPREKRRFFGLFLPYQILRFLFTQTRSGAWRRSLSYLRWTFLGLRQEMGAPPPEPMMRRLGLR
jgi:N-acetylglucosaminyl-diphospho-decaprenol L-rhamnosyltransferase